MDVPTILTVYLKEISMNFKELEKRQKADPSFYARQIVPRFTTYLEISDKIISDEVLRNDLKQFYDPKAMRMTILPALDDAIPAEGEDRDWLDWVYFRTEAALNG